MTASSRTAVVLVVLRGAGRGPDAAPRAAAPAVRETATSGALGRPHRPGLPGAHQGRRRPRSGWSVDPPGSGAVRGGTVLLGPVAGPLGPEVLTRGPVAALSADQARGGTRLRADGPAAAGLWGFRTDRGPGPSLAVTTCAAPRGPSGGSPVPAPASTTPRRCCSPTSTPVRPSSTSGCSVPTASCGAPAPAGSWWPRTRRGGSTSRASPRRSTTSPSTCTPPAAAWWPRSTTPCAARRRPPRAWSGWPRPTGPPAGCTWRGSRAAARGRTLLVANPSTLEAAVDVGVSGASGTFTPTGLAPVTVAPGTIKSVDVSRVVPAGEPSGIRLRSRVPVVASLRSATGARPRLRRPGGARWWGRRPPRSWPVPGPPCS